MSKNMATIQAFKAAWNAKDVDALMGLLTDDVRYQNMPSEPVVGVENVRKILGPFISTAESIRFEVSHIAETSDGAVLVAKREHYVFKGTEVVLDSMNTFELRDGKISLWRAYFNPSQWTGGSVYKPEVSTGVL